MKKRELLYLIIIVLTMAIVVFANIFTPYTDEYETITFDWDEYDTTVGYNIYATHFQLWQISTSNTPVTMLLDSIPINDTSCSVDFLANGLTYNVALIVVAGDKTSDLSNIATFTVTDKRKPFSVSNFRRRL